MRATKAALLITVALAAACAKKTKPADLPPPPPPAQQTTPPPSDTTPPPASTGGNYAPGSAADFAANTQGVEVHFGYDSYELDGEARGILDSQSAWLAKYPSTRITVEGHADERGTREYNLALGERRANAVKTYLSGKGMTADRASTISYGKERPEAEGSDEAAYAKNRRAVTDIGAARG